MLNPGMSQSGSGAMSQMMSGVEHGTVERGMMGGTGSGATGMAPMNHIMAQQAGPRMPAMSARMRLEQIRAQNLQLIRAWGGQYPAGAGPMMGNPPLNYRSPIMTGMPPGGPGGMMITHDMQQQMLLRYQQVQQRRLQIARMQQMQVQQRRAAAMQQMAAGSYPAGAAQGQQYAMRPRPSPMQANPLMPMGQMMQPPQQTQYAQQPPGMMMPGGPRPPGQPTMGYQPGMNPNMQPGQPPMYR